MKIKSIDIICNNPYRYYIGQEINGQLIDHFKERTIEWESGIDFIYHAEDKDGNVIVAIENCPTVIEYEKQ